MKETPSLIVRYIARRAVPFIQLYALYVLGHGEDGPGGGFQGGVIFAASFVLLALAYGWGRGRASVPEKVADVIAPAGCLLYAGIGFVSLLIGGAFLQYDAFAGPGADQAARKTAHHFGLIGIELGVMLTVTASMVILFFEMARPAEDEAAEEGATFEQAGHIPEGPRAEESLDG
ncbi:MAG: Na(+)/H(+) antiporter subunit B [Planctomycetota bacterium]|nr:Na(+)/H(+) antiporter subunit B [Planctomycetota bacterium]